MLNWFSDCGMGLEYRVGDRNLSVIEAQGPDSECGLSNNQYGELIPVHFVV